MKTLLGIPHLIWATLARPASSLNVNHREGGTASLQPGGSIEILERDTEFGDLCRYRTPQGVVAAGALCPDNALVFIPHDLAGRLPAFEKVQSDAANLEARRRAIVSRHR